MINLHIVWDFDAAIGQINSSYPYNFNEINIHTELENVEKLLEIAQVYNTLFTFAITGFTAEDGLYPFHAQDIIRRIYHQGHEIASHSWRHEWIPIIQKKQIIKTMERSKFILERCVDHHGIVNGFVLPHNRPMTWIRKGSFSFGDRGIYPFFPGGDLGNVIKIANKAGYKWIRVSHHPIYRKLSFFNGTNRIIQKFGKFRNLITVPNHYTGFDKTAISTIQKGISEKKDIVLSGHPLMLSRPEKTESIIHLTKLLDFCIDNGDKVKITPVNKNPILL